MTHTVNQLVPFLNITHTAAAHRFYQYCSIGCTADSSDTRLRYATNKQSYLVNGFLRATLLNSSAISTGLSGWYADFNYDYDDDDDYYYYYYFEPNIHKHLYTEHWRIWPSVKDSTIWCWTSSFLLQCRSVHKTTWWHEELTISHNRG